MKISAKDSINTELIKNLDFKEIHINKERLFFKIDSLSLLFEKMGFLNNRLDTILKKDSIYTARFNLGNSVKTIKVYYNKDLISKEFIQQVSSTITDEYFEVDIHALQKTLNTIVSLFEEQGNSFTEIKLSAINIIDTTIKTTLNINTSATRYIDKIIVKGVDNFPQSFIKHYFKIDQKTIFNSKKLNKISKQINALSFVSESKPPEILFTNDSTYVYLYLKKKKSNQFDGLIGFSSNGENDNLTFNGYLDVMLNNIFNGGEKIALQWKNNGDNRQLFNFKVTLPYIFNSSFTTEANLNIYKQDSTFINTTAAVKLGYALDYRNTIGLSYIGKSSTNLLNNSLSNLNDFNSNLYGIYYNYTISNNSFIYPVKFNFALNAHTGNRKTDVLNSSQSHFSLDTYYLININLKNNIHLESANGLLVSDEYFVNELFRIGGIKSIRGFNEESIFASLYNILKVEYRYTTNSSSYLYTISDFGNIENKLENLNQKIYSLGVGYAFSTNFGNLNLSYALGKSNKESFDFNNSRFHISIVSFF